MKCLRCYTETNRTCNICNTPYCNAVCQDSDVRNHIVFCHPLLHERIKSCVDFAINVSGDKEWNLSRGYTPASIPDYSVTPYGDIRKVHCALCANSVSIFGPLMYCLYPKDVKKLYTVCEKCRQTGKQLCPVTMAETRICFVLYGIVNWLTFLACIKLRGIRMPKDIRQLIYGKIDGCCHLKI